MAQTLMVFGCGGLTGLRFANYSVLPSVFKQMTGPTSWLGQFWEANLAYTLVPLASFFASITLIDSMNLYGVVPAFAGFAFLATCTYF